MREGIIQAGKRCAGSMPVSRNKIGGPESIVQRVRRKVEAHEAGGVCQVRSCRALQTVLKISSLS